MPKPFNKIITDWINRGKGKNYPPEFKGLNREIVRYDNLLKVRDILNGKNAKGKMKLKSRLDENDVTKIKSIVRNNLDGLSEILPTSVEFSTTKSSTKKMMQDIEKALKASEEKIISLDAALEQRKTVAQVPSVSPPPANTDTKLMEAMAKAHADRAAKLKDTINQQNTSTKNSVREDSPKQTPTDNPIRIAINSALRAHQASGEINVSKLQITNQTIDALGATLVTLSKSVNPTLIQEFCKEIGDQFAQFLRQNPKQDRVREENVTVIIQNAMAQFAKDHSNIPDVDKIRVKVYEKVEPKKPTRAVPTVKTVIDLSQLHELKGALEDEQVKSFISKLKDVGKQDKEALGYINDALKGVMNHWRKPETWSATNLPPPPPNGDNLLQVIGEELKKQIVIAEHIQSVSSPNKSDVISKLDDLAKSALGEKEVSKFRM